MRTMVLEYKSLQNWVIYGVNVGKCSIHGASGGNNIIIASIQNVFKMFDSVCLSIVSTVAAPCAFKEPHKQRAALKGSSC